MPPTAVSSEKTEGIPDWVKNTATWWSTGAITDREFVSSMQHLIKIGIISIDNIPVQETTPISDNSELGKLQTQLDSCIDIKKAYDRLNCERSAEAAITAYNYKQNGEAYQVGPISFYYVENEFEITSTGQAILSLSLLAENTGSNDNVAMMCTGPSICNYDVWNGDKAYKYSGTNFTNGQIVLKPGESKEFNILFGPNIGYGGTTFEYHPSKNYYFRISEPWGSFNIPITLG